MKTISIPFVGIEHFNEHPDLVIYMDEDIAIIDNLSNIIKTEEEYVKLDCMLIILCQEGSLKIHINGHRHLLQKDYCAILPSGTTLRRTASNQSYTLKIAAISRFFLNETVSSPQENWDILSYISDNPIFPVKQNSSYKMYLYKELLLTLIQEKQHRYSRKSRRYHFAGMFCELMATLHKMIPEHKSMEFNLKRSTTITRRFMDLVNADNGVHRSVNYYANQLCYTPKYMSSVIKQVTGKTPLQIIHEHSIKVIKHKLKHSSMSIKELTDFFEFPNTSFFGKFVKTHIGMPPQQYRLSKEED